MRFQMKVDMWVRVILYSILLMFFVLMFFVPKDEVIVIAIVTLCLAIIIIPLFYTYYELRDDYLFIQISIITKRISYNDIKSIKLCKNWKSRSPMTSERIEIKEHNKGSIRGTTYIGPENRDDMLKELVKRCTNIQKEAN